MNSYCVKVMAGNNQLLNLYICLVCILVSERRFLGEFTANGVSIVEVSQAKQSQEAIAYR